MIAKPRYNGHPIGSISVLAKVLGITEANLRQLALNSNSLFRKRSIEKNRKNRIVYDAFSQLKGIHEKINCCFLRRVDYPDYLHGGIKGKDYISDCRLHFKTTRGITQDISNFFPSIRKADVRKIWQYFFKFPPDVAELLSELTTLSGYIPQGAKTSGFLANLLFWEREPDLVCLLMQKGFRYTRFVDDITITTQRNIADCEKNEIINLVRAMFRSYSLKPNRKKSLVQTGRTPITAHGLQIGQSIPTKQKTERRKIRSWLYRLEKLSDNNLTDSELQTLAGKIGIIRRLHPQEGLFMKERLDALFARLRALDSN